MPLPRGDDAPAADTEQPAPGAVIAALPNIMSGNTLHHLEQLIDGLSAGVILMDPAGSILWANGAALAMHGVTAVDQLGRNCDEFCSHFSLRDQNHGRLPAREYPVTRALAGESFDGLIVEVAPVGTDEPRWVHQVRNVALSDADGEADCIALVIQDVSARFEAEQRFEAMFQANPAPALIARLTDQRFVKVNQGFLELAGYARDAVIGKSLFELDILQGAERREFAKERLAAGKVIPQMETELPLPSGGHGKLVIVAGQPIELSDQPCMLFTFADLEPRRKAETALRAGERHFATVFQMAPTAMVLTAPDRHRIIDANEAFGRMTGYSIPESIGRAPDDLELWEDARQREVLEAEIVQRGGIRNCDVRVLHKSGDAIDCLLSAERIHLRDEDFILWLYQDITARRHTEIELIEAIEAVMKETSWFSRSVMEKLANMRHPRRGHSAPQVAELTRRERGVLELICEGLDDKAIAEQLAVSNNTVRNHVARIYAKIGVNRRSAAMIWARERGIESRSSHVARDRK